MAELIDPEPFTTIYDPACGSGGLLIKAQLLDELLRAMLEELRPKGGGGAGGDANQWLNLIQKLKTKPAKST